MAARELTVPPVRRPFLVALALTAAVTPIVRTTPMTKRPQTTMTDARLR